MRFFAFILAWGWIQGLALGAWQGSWWIVCSAALFLGLITFRSIRSFPLAVLAVSLVLLAAVYAQPSAAASTACLPGVATEGIITAPPQLSSGSGRYAVALTIPACNALIVTERFPAYALGDTIRLDGGSPTSRDDIAKENPGYARYLEDRGIAFIWRYPDVTRTQQSQLVRAALHTRASHTIAQLFVEPDASVVHALILADDSAIPQYLEDNFRATGLTHLLAISGMNISLWAGLLIVMLAPLHLPALVSSLFITGALWSYMYFLQWPISAVRATVFLTLALLGLRLRLLIGLPTILLITVFLLTTLYPGFFRDVGFQLSVGAVLGIFIMLFLTRTALRGLSTSAQVCLGSVLVTVGATLTTWPIIAYHFHTVSLLGIVANALVAPVVALQMVFVALTLALGMVSPAAALLPSFVTHLTVRWMDVVSQRFAEVPWSLIENVHLPIWGLLLYYGLLGAGAAWWLKWQRRDWREIWQ